LRATDKPERAGSTPHHEESVMARKKDKQAQKDKKAEKDKKKA
jgi:hypothetical protein